MKMTFQYEIPINNVDIYLNLLYKGCSDVKWCCFEAFQIYGVVQSEMAFPKEWKHDRLQLSLDSSPSNPRSVVVLNCFWWNVQIFVCMVGEPFYAPHKRYVIIQQFDNHKQQKSNEIF